MFAFNPKYLLLILPALLSWLAQAKVREVYEKHQATPIRWRINGLEVARRLLAHAGLADVAIERAPGTLTDHYDPQAKVLRLSDEMQWRPSRAIAQSARRVPRPINVGLCGLLLILGLDKRVTLVQHHRGGVQPGVLPLPG
jgi:Zn-dependent membrane protease YugP